ncbi:hypothetical membrane protein [Trichinella spiralis]|uniref:hypothetical membrane protein n=1 Tax=Trichinella spiralis TaxID=6334 RepID=UPI0001EFC9C9|nr:hypothetical membrane protein [Trichinella spiralis]
MAMTLLRFYPSVDLSVAVLNSASLFKITNFFLFTYQPQQLILGLALCAFLGYCQSVNWPNDCSGLAIFCKTESITNSRYSRSENSFIINSANNSPLDIVIA